MNAERAWFAIWVTVFLPALVGLCGAFLPAYPAVRLAVAPVWMAWSALQPGASLKSGAKISNHWPATSGVLR